MTEAWPKVPLGDVLTPVERPVLPVPGTAYRQLGVQLWGRGVYERDPIDGSQTKYLRLFRAEEGDIIANKIWARNGSVAVVTDETAGCYGSGEFPMFAPKRDQLDPRWMHWITKTAWFWASCDEKSQGTSGKNRIRPERFLEILIPLPPLSEQQRVVARIEELAALVEQARVLQRRAAEQTQQIITRASSRAYDIAATAGGLRRLDELCVQITDGTHVTPYYVETGVPFLSVKDITNGRISFDRCRHIAPDEHAVLTRRCKPLAGDVLLTKVGTTGFAKAIDVEREFSIFVSLALLKLNRTLLDPRFTEYMLNSTALRERSAQGTRGVGNKNLVLKFIREFPVPAPSLSEQRRIVAELDDLRAGVDALEGLQTGTALEFDSLLPAILGRAFKGTPWA